ncbi:4Fe-4S binding protein [Candidatus Parcubacteria bacterium]|nr:4Fe-4S binding protein [Candidatus Parcubacteria bacterium]
MAVALGMGEKNPQILNMTLPDFRAKIIANPNTITAKIDHLVIGSPVHSGKLPLQVLECLKFIKGNEIKTTAIVVYGNRGYGISLHSMVEQLFKNEFNVVTAGTFIGQHSYPDIVPIALGRPDKSDIKKAQEFGIQSLNVTKKLSIQDIPIQIDSFSKSEKYDVIKPTYNKELCIQCGVCAKSCPMGILLPTGKYLNKEAEKQCIGCMACVRVCPKNARIAKVNLAIKVIMKIILGRALKKRKEPFVIISEK